MSDSIQSPTDLRKLTRENTLAGAAARNLARLSDRRGIYWTMAAAPFVVIAAKFLYTKSNDGYGETERVKNAFELLFERYVLYNYYGSMGFYAFLVLLFILFVFLTLRYAGQIAQKQRRFLDVAGFLNEARTTANEYGLGWGGRSNSGKPSKQGSIWNADLMCILFRPYMVVSSMNDVLKRVDGVIWQSAVKYANLSACDMQLEIDKNKKTSAWKNKRNRLIYWIVFLTISIYGIYAFIFTDGEFAKMCAFLLLGIYGIIYYGVAGENLNKNSNLEQTELPGSLLNIPFILLVCMAAPVVVGVMFFVAFIMLLHIEIKRIFARYKHVHDLFTELIRTENTQVSLEGE